MKKLLLLLSVILTAQSFMAWSYSEDILNCKLYKENYEILLNELQLVGAQKNKIALIMDRQEHERYLVKEKFLQVRREENNAFRSGTLTTERMQYFIKQEEALFGALAKIRLIQRIEVSTVLTEEQKRILYEKMQACMKYKVSDLDS